jgi:ubiquinone biosynthesis protein UbiJ
MFYCTTSNALKKKTAHVKRLKFSFKFTFFFSQRTCDAHKLTDDKTALKMKCFVSIQPALSLKFSAMHQFQEQCLPNYHKLYHTHFTMNSLMV